MEPPEELESMTAGEKISISSSREKAVTETPRIVRKRPMIAAALSAIVPGLGHLYAGRKRRAALIMLLMVPSFFAILFLVFAMSKFFGMLLFLSWVLVWVWQVRDSYDLTERMATQRHMRSAPRM